MLRQFLVGGGVSVVNIVIHALVMTIVVRVAQTASAKKKLQPSLFLIAVMIPTVSLLMTTHTLKVIVWSFAYSIADAAPPDANLVYFAFVNYTTLGYGRRCSSGALAAFGPNDCDKRCTAIRVVDRCYF